MKKLVGVLIIAVMVVGGIIYKESIDRTATLNSLNKNTVVMSSTKNDIVRNFTNNDVLSAANKNNSYNFNKVLNKEVSGDIMSAKLENAKGDNYIVDLEIIGGKLYPTGKVIDLKNKEKENLLLNNKENSSSGSIIVTENNGNSEKQSDYIEGTLGSNSNSKKNNYNVDNGNDAIKFVLNYYKNKDKSLEVKNLQSIVLANQNIDGEAGYLVQVYDNENNHNKNIGVLLVTKNGNLYNANTDPLEKLN